VKPCRIRSAFSAFSARRLTVLPGEPSMEARELSRRMGTIDEDLGQIEKDIRQLKIEYDQYFGGGRKRPPTDIEWRIDLLVKRYNERGGDLKFAQRFRFNNLAQTYAKYKDIFRKKTAMKKEGCSGISAPPPRKSKRPVRGSSKRKKHPQPQQAARQKHSA